MGPATSSPSAHRPRGLVSAQRRPFSLSMYDVMRGVATSEGATALNRQVRPSVKASARVRPAIAAFDVAYQAGAAPAARLPATDDTFTTLAPAPRSATRKRR